MFDELLWTPDGLRREGYFVIRDGRIQRNVPDNSPENSATECGFAQVGGATAVLASVLSDREEEDSYSWQGEHMIFRGDSAVEHRVLWSNEPRPGTSVLLDPDGKGVGALRFMFPRDGGPRFEFYRL
jgi:hypothetical protein